MVDTDPDELDYRVDYNGVVHRSDGTDLPWGITYNGLVYDADDRRLPLKLAYNGTLVVDLSDDGLSRSRRVQALMGRPKNSGAFAHPGELAEAFRAQIQSNSSRSRSLATAPRAIIASWLGISDSTLKRTLSRWKISMKAVRTGRLEVGQNDPF
jgi:hypothetical protein